MESARHSWRLAWGALAFGAVLAGARAAGAQPPPLAEPPSDAAVMHTVRLRGATPGATWEIYPKSRAGEGPPLARCGESGCTLALPDGTYRLRVEGRGMVTSFRTLTVTSDLDLTVSAPSRARRDAGRAMVGLGAGSLCLGSILASVGWVLSFAEALNAMAETGDADGCIECGPLLYGGLGMMVVGPLMVPVGWVTLARNRHPRVKPAVAATTDSLAPPRVELGLQPLGTGYGLGARVKF